MPFDEQGGIRETGFESLKKEEVLKTVEPGSGCLFEAVESTVETTQMMRLRGIPIARWLLHEDLLSEKTVKKGIVHVQLVKTLLKHDG